MPWLKSITEWGPDKMPDWKCHQTLEQWFKLPLTNYQQALPKDGGGLVAAEWQASPNWWVQNAYIWSQYKVHMPSGKGISNSAHHTPALVLSSVTNFQLL